MKLNGQLTISRPATTQGEGWVSIEVYDVDARARAITVKVSVEEFCNAIFSLACRPCEFEWNASGVVGTIGQNKEELVPTPDFRVKDEDIDKILAPFCVDGWHPRHGDITNGHCHVRKGDQNYQRVVFFRNVPKDTGVSVIDGGKR